MSVTAKKKAEGEEHIRLAEKYLKTSLTKWSPDHDSAGDEFSKAATCFKVAKCNEAALDALERACECFKQCRSLYQAAKMLEQAVLVCRDSERLDLISGLAERGGLLYRQHGSPESAAQLLEKAAKIIESKKPTEALELYQKAAETIMVEDRPKQAAEYLTKVGRLQVKAKQWDRAIETLENTIKLMQESGSVSTSGRLVCGLVLVHLVREDVVAAAKAFSVWGGYCDVDQSAAINTILTGFNDEDSDMAKRGLASGAIKNLDVEFAIMAKSEIKLPAEGGGGLEAAAAEFGAQRAPPPPPADEERQNFSTTEHHYGVDPVEASAFGETREQREEDARQKQKDEEEEDEEEGLC